VVPTISDREAAVVTPVDTAAPYVRRFSRESRLLHAVLMTCFLGLAATGLPLLFSEAPWARALSAAFGGFRGAGFVHRLFGAVLLGALVWHVGRVLWRAVVRREQGILWGPGSMVPQPRDVADIFRQVRWFVKGGPQPRFEQFAYWEKFDYWAVLWGTAIMGAAGLVLWFPEAASRLLPGWMFNVALLVHGAEALLAIGFIFVIHFFNGHLRPGKFPMDLVIFTGVVPKAELRHERADQYDRLARSGALERLAAPPPAPLLVRRARLVGSAGLTIGLGLFVLILYAVLR
jgi:cytochrome b subunit of formate dehydrogenase